MFFLKNKKFFSITFCLVFVFTIFIFSTCYTYDANDAKGYLNTASQEAGAKGQTDIKSVATGLAKGAFALTGILFFIFIFYSAFIWMTARDNEEEANKARRTMIGAVIGFVLVVSSYAITNFVFDRVVAGNSGGSGGSDSSGNGETEVEGELGCCAIVSKPQAGMWGNPLGLTQIPEGFILGKTACDVYISSQEKEDWAVVASTWTKDVKDASVCQAMAEKLID